MASHEYYIDFSLTDTLVVTKVSRLTQSALVSLSLRDSNYPDKSIGARFDLGKARFLDDIEGTDRNLFGDDILHDLVYEIITWGQPGPRTGPMRFEDDRVGLFITGPDLDRYSLDMWRLWTWLNADEACSKYISTSSFPEFLHLMLFGGKSEEVQVMHRWASSFLGKERADIVPSFYFDRIVGPWIDNRLQEIATDEVCTEDPEPII